MGLRIPCLRCGKFDPECQCPPLPPEPEEAPPPPAAAPAPAVKARPEIIKMRREKRGGGREVTILEGFPRDVDVDEIARDLKRTCGVGGSAKNGVIELQGDCRDRVAAGLLGHGFKSKRAGG